MAFSDTELLAYVEDRLSLSRRAEVEGFLACNPDLAASVMEALHRRERTRSAIVDTVRGVGRFARATRLAAACLACGIVGWGVAEALDDDGPFRDLSSTPQYVDEAVMSQRATRIRIGMTSQPETPRLDPAEILRAMQIRLPVLPLSWRLLDVQVFPSDDGPSVSLFIETAPGRELSLFAVRASTRVSGTPVVTSSKGEYAAYWEEEGGAYVLTGEGSSNEILADAALLSHNGMM